MSWDEDIGSNGVGGEMDRHDGTYTYGSSFEGQGLLVYWRGFFCFRFCSLKKHNLKLTHYESDTNLGKTPVQDG